MNVNDYDNRISLELAIESAPYYNIGVDEAKGMVNQIVKIVNENRENLAKQYGISRGSIEYMRPAFGLNEI